MAHHHGCDVCDDGDSQSQSARTVFSHDTELIFGTKLQRKNARGQRNVREAEERSC
jgi:hypothetical protein